MTTRTYIGDPVTTPDGNDYRVYTEHWANEAVDTIALEGLACLMYFDPGTRTGRAAINGLIANLQSALASHDGQVTAIYANLKPGDDPARIRVAVPAETRCPSIFTGQQCVRVDHVDPIHVAIEDTATTHAVSAVWRA